MGGTTVAKRLTYYILAGLVIGIVIGWAINAGMGGGTPEADARIKDVTYYIRIPATVFLNLIKMIIAPLVFSTLVAGIAHMGDTKALGRVGVKSLGWFICASIFSLSL